MDSTSLRDAFVACNRILDDLGYTFSFESGLFSRGPRLVLMDYVGDKLCTWGNDWELSFEKGGDLEAFLSQFRLYV